jgi:hypothetical protein
MKPPELRDGIYKTLCNPVAWRDLPELLEPNGELQDRVKRVLHERACQISVYTVSSSEVPPPRALTFDDIADIEADMRQMALERNRR